MNNTQTAEPSKIILDHKENLTLPDDKVKEHIYAQSARDRLAEGLFWIYREVERIEHYTKQRAEKNNILISLGGEDIGNPPLGRLSCAFQWYAVSIFNYVQLTGWLAYHNPKQTKAYVHRAIPNIAKYRNKVAAHFAITHPFEDDNAASVTAGLMTNIVYAEGRFYAGAFSPQTIHGQEADESNLTAWSVTSAHQELMKRFWPMGQPKSFQSMMVPAGNSVKIKLNYLKGP
jgi:hypothetical protein